MSRIDDLRCEPGQPLSAEDKAALATVTPSVVIRPHTPKRASAAMPELMFYEALSDKIAGRSIRMPEDPEHRKAVQQLLDDYDALPPHMGVEMPAEM
jgi:hypothetical protein